VDELSHIGVQSCMFRRETVLEKGKRDPADRLRVILMSQLIIVLM